METLSFPSSILGKSSTGREPLSKSSPTPRSRFEVDRAELGQQKGKKKPADTDSDRIMEIHKIIDNSKKFKKDFYKRICASKLASAKEPAISPIKRRKVRSERWIEKKNFEEDQQLKRKLSDDETATESKRPKLETNVEVINLSEDDNGPGEETDLESSITVEEFKIENIDQYTDHQQEEHKSGIKIELEKKSFSSDWWENNAGTMESRPPPVSVPRKKRNKKIVGFSTKITGTVWEKASVAVSHVNLDQVEDILDLVSYVCETCNKSFISLPGLKSHITKMHKDNYTDESCLNGISNYIIDTDPLVPQVKSLSENLQRLAVNDDNLAVQFSILLTFPQFSNLIKTFLRFYQKPINKIQPDLKEFADCLLRYNYVTYFFNFIFLI